MKVRFPGVIGRGCRTPDATTIQTTYDYNGGGPNDFGGAAQWPVLQLFVRFEEDHEENAELLAERLELWLREQGVIK